MEGFDLLATGAWSIVPPLLALALAIVSKEVYSSLLVGVLSGLLIYEFALDGPSVSSAITAFTLIPHVMAEQIAGNGGLILFLALLGALVVVIATAGGSRAYAEFVSTRVKNARMAQILAAVLGIIIFVDDYFNCLTVGAVMRPVTDRFRISHEKLAWIIDSTAAPVCIIAPVSSWAVAIGGYMGEDGFATFVASIPYNFYALFTIFFVFFMLIINRDFGPMRTAQQAAEAGEKVNLKVSSALKRAATMGIDHKEDEHHEDRPKVPSIVAEESIVTNANHENSAPYAGLAVSDKGTVFDLLVPIATLIVFSIVGMMYTGGFFKGVDFATAVGENPIGGLCIGVFVALVVAAAMFLPRGLTTLSGFTEGMSEGVRSMVGAIMILVLAWSLGAVCRYMIGTGEFVSGFLTSIGASLTVLPAIVFVVAAFIAFAMGTSWGTVALILPIVLGVFPPDSPLFLVAIGATLGGAVYGDHVSPISDTTILSSTGAQCNHLRHVSTQLPYATVVMVVCVASYLISGFVDSPWPGLAFGFVALTVAIPVLTRKGRKSAA
ncbi:sodium:proton antiporter [Eggerthellaceae bacterium zg-1084]|uniref:Sodium:proton antiporter n=1 Tax=Berryella wangjianweii TaxID=2734634 RepID=A0A6M8J0R9_9ACTN|nr:Na+/H+ antiporter NhaC family protein [Berryella wangjianweii]NPD30969.1 sodium:proton antiporter [Berryella wangjianweii]NPD31834.1 sodium:proton antiporter [Eggerthellaceae bacterium zg-997]QKF07570.1 sodium:proton antiporter [Berryella wangjianweii]